MTWACSARTPAAVPTPAQTDQQGEKPTHAATAPEPEPPRVVDPPPRAAVDECALIDLPGEPIATIGLIDRIDPSNALHPSNASERLLFGQLYETLVRVDCMGRVRPGLASSWRVERNVFHLWYVTLREDARFSDGAPVSAADVRAGWTRDGVGGELGTHVRRHVQSVDVVDDRTLVIQLSTPRIDAPTVLAHPDLAVAKWVADSPFPLGTRLSRLDVARDAARGVALSDTDDQPREPSTAPVSRRYRRSAGSPGRGRGFAAHARSGDARLRRHVAALSAGAARVAANPRFRHSRTVNLVTFAIGERTTGAGQRRGSGRGAWSARPVLVRDRTVPSMGPLVECDRTSPLRESSTTPMTERHAISPSGSWPWLMPRVPRRRPFLDAILPDRPRRTFQRATGLTGEALANARQLGLDAGYIVSVDSRPLEPCNDLLTLMDRHLSMAQARHDRPARRHPPAGGGAPRAIGRDG